MALALIWTLMKIMNLWESAFLFLHFVVEHIRLLTCITYQASHLSFSSLCMSSSHFSCFSYFILNIIFFFWRKKILISSSPRPMLIVEEMNKWIQIICVQVLFQKSFLQKHHCSKSENQLKWYILESSEPRVSKIVTFFFNN